MRPMTGKLHNVVKLVMGRKGCGKSTYVKSQIREYQGRVIVIDTVGEYSGLRITTGEDLDQRLKMPLARLRIVPEKLEDVLAVFDYAYARGRLCLVVDEFGVWATPQDVPEPIQRALRLGRHRELDLILVTRRPAEVPRLASAMADFLVIFETHEPVDSDWIRKTAGDAVAEQARTLGKFHYIEYDLDGGKVRISETHDFDDF